MKKVFFIFAIALYANSSLAQQTITYTQMFDSLLFYISKSDATTGVLYDRVVSFSCLTEFTNNSISDTSNSSHFVQAYDELYRAAFLPINPLPYNSEILQTKNNVFSGTDTLNIGILHYQFNIIDTNVFWQKVYFDNDSILQEDTSVHTSLYLEKTAFVASALIETISQSNVIFYINDSLYFDNTNNTITQLLIDFDDGLGLRSVNFNAFISVNYAQEGTKTLFFKAVLSNGDTIITFSTIDYNSTYQGPIQKSNRPYEEFKDSTAIVAKIDVPNDYYQGAFSKNKGDVRIYYHDVNAGLQKPILIVDGFDPGNKRRFEEKSEGSSKTMWEVFNYKDQYSQTKHLGDYLIDELGYDLVLLDFPDGGGFIEKNAMVCVEVIRIIDSLLNASGSNEQIVVIGPSMGGQITRYALAYMEQHPEDPNTNFGKHNCRLWVSFDSPHQGANISMGAQIFMYFFGEIAGLQKAKIAWDSIVNCPAAKQMLVKQFNKYSINNTCSLHIYSYPKNNYFTIYYNNHLNNVGYPINLRKVAVANGSLNGSLNSNACDNAIELDASFNIRISKILTMPNAGTCEIFYGMFSASQCDYFFGKRKKLWVFADGDNNCSMDVAPGGYFNTFKIINDVAKGIKDVKKTTLSTENHCFMPITSVLDLEEDMNHCTNFSNIDLVAENKTPFDAYWGSPNANMEHVTFNYHLVDWLINEIETYIEGERSIPVCEIQSYTLHLPSGKENTNVTWYCSSNLKIVAGKNSNTVLIKATGKGDAWIYAEANNLTHSKRLGKFHINIEGGNAYEDAPLLSSGNHEWNQPYQLLEPLHIFSGTTLTIRNTLYCSPTVKIVVHPGAKLIIDGGILTNICDGELWQGIYVKGNPSDPTQHESMQGVVELINDAVIENAVCAINVEYRLLGINPVVRFYGGGIVKAENTSFINNKKAIIFGPYERHLQVGLTENRNNVSWFKNCTFIVNNDALFDINEFKEHVKLIGVRGITFAGCSFDGINYIGSAIYSSSSGFYLANRLIFDPMNQERNHFSNFNIAINIEDGGTKAISIYNSDFHNNNICIQAEGASELYIRANTLNIPYSPYYGPTTGISLTNCSRFYIDNNTFHGVWQCNYGLIVHHSEANNNIVKNNTFSFLNTACLAYGKNSDGANVINGYKGLQYHCNWYEENGKDIVVEDYEGINGNIRFVQGETDKASGNIFSLNGTNLYSPDYTFQYFYKNDTLFPRHIPLNSSSNIYLEPKNSDVCNYQIGVINPNIAPYDPPTNWNDELTTQYNQINNMLLPLKDHYISMGYNQLPIDWQMYFYGGYIPPYLEEQVNLYYAINDLENELSEVCKQAVYYVHSDELFDFEAYHSWLTRIHSPEADYLLAESYYETKQYGECFDVLNNIPTQYETFNDIEHQNYLLFYNLKEQLRGSGQTWSDISEGSVEYQQLNAIAVSGINGAAFKARAILSAYFDQVFSPIIFEPELLDLCIYIANLTGDGTSGEEGEEVGITMQKNDTSKLSLRPNPALDELTIDNGINNIQEVSIFDVLGKELKRCSVNNSKITLNISDLSSGIYILKASTQKGIHIKKFVKE